VKSEFEQARLYVQNPAQQLAKAFTPAQLRREILSKAMTAMSGGRITGPEATAIETALNMGLAPEKELLDRIFGGRPLLKSLGGGQWQRAVGARASRTAPPDHPAPVRTSRPLGVRYPGAFARLCKELALQSRRNR
jgi:hypothetical protein